MVEMCVECETSPAVYQSKMAPDLFICAHCLIREFVPMDNWVVLE